MNDQALVKIDAARRALVEARSVPEVKDIRDKAAAIESYLKKKDGAGEASQIAAELKVRAERKLGELLDETVNHKGAKGVGRTMRRTLPDGVTKDDSSRWQRIAKLPENIFEKEVAEAKDQDNLTTSKILKTANRYLTNEGKTTKLKKAGQTLVVPSDWSYELIHGDCLKELPTIDAGAARLVFADPPYNIGIDYGEGSRADRLPDEKYLGWCQAWMEECLRLLTPDGSLWVLIGDEYAAEFVILLKNLGLHRRSWIKWYETFGVNCTKNFNRCSRHLLYFVKNPKRFVFNDGAVNRPSDRQTKYNDGRANPTGKIWDDVWQIPRLVGTAKERIPDFPTQLPQDLLRPVIGCASDPGDLVIDPFCGSATTGVVCFELGRDFIGIEKIRDFARLADQRIISAMNQAMENKK